ncbi:MAG TPA: mechanosensitive ion channel family protein [Bryobacteraceae bacterium]|nr:mechanosensitive ion channel family protein [Bryobacteraceae bacterium]
MALALVGVGQHLPTFALPAGLFVAVFSVGWIARGVLFRMLDKWAVRSPTRLDDLFVNAIRKPFLLWILILALMVATRSADLPVRVETLLSQTLLVLWIVSLTMVAVQIAGTLVALYGKTNTSALPVTTLTQSIARMAVATIGALILLDSLQISIAPILTALGVGGLAVALALQDTLSNLFAGFYVTIAGQVRVGDYIKLDSGEEGYVADINWRSTTIRALANNLIVVPNAKLAQAIVTNYYLPEKRTAVFITASVPFSCDPEEIENMLVEEAMSAMGSVKGLLAEPAPFVRFNPGVGAYSLDFTLICQVAEFVDQYYVQHEMRKRIYKRFRLERIEVPYPFQVVSLKDRAGNLPVPVPES